MLNSDQSKKYTIDEFGVKYVSDMYALRIYL